ncbi:2-5A-dependent ribonuclease-like isoform X2 [Salminus brasiliensis]
MDPADVSLSVQETSHSTIQPWNLQKIFHLSLQYSDDSSKAVHHGSSGSVIMLGCIGGDKVAVKKSPKTEDSMNEVASLRRLNHSNIIQYRFSFEKQDSIYLITELCKGSLKEHIRNVQPAPQQRLQLVKDIVCGLEFLHRCKKIVHGDVRQQHVVVDEDGRAKLTDFKKSKTVEDADGAILDEIQEVGKLAYYILSGGQSYPEGPESWVSKDIILDFTEWMTHQDPTKRRSLLDTLSHPIFWTDSRKLRYLQDVGNLPEVVQFSGRVLREVNKITKGKSFQRWRSTVENNLSDLLKEMEDHRKPYPDNTLGLLRFIRNLYQHRREDALSVSFTSLFPDLFETIYLFAEEKQWNSTISLQMIFKD